MVIPSSVPYYNLPPPIFLLKKPQFSEVFQLSLSAAFQDDASCIPFTCILSPGAATCLLLWVPAFLLVSRFSLFLLHFQVASLCDEMTFRSPEPFCGHRANCLPYASWQFLFSSPAWYMEVAEAIPLPIKAEWTTFVFLFPITYAAFSKKVFPSAALWPLGLDICFILCGKKV